jgi:RNA polymerase sigma-70 factor (ECF subfamily)
VTNQSTFAVELPAGLLTGLRSGDLSAFERLFRLFERPVFSLANRMLGDQDEAMEAMHDTFLKVSTALPSFRGDSPFWGWLRKIAVNETLMRLRRRASLPSLDLLDNHDQLAFAEQSPQQHAEAAQLERAMATLPDLTRVVMWLYHAEGYTHDEIAQLMGRSASFSKSQLARGTQKLRVMLTGQHKERRHVS